MNRPELTWLDVLAVLCLLVIVATMIGAAVTGSTAIIPVTTEQPK